MLNSIVSSLTLFLVLLHFYISTTFVLPMEFDGSNSRNFLTFREPTSSSILLPCSVPGMEYSFNGSEFISLIHPEIISVNQTTGDGNLYNDTITGSTNVTPLGSNVMHHFNQSIGYSNFGEAVQIKGNISWVSLETKTNDLGNKTIFHPIENVKQYQNKTNFVKGKWSDKEDRCLKILVNKFGEESWSKIAKELNWRTVKQCKDRWQNHLKSNIKKGTWTTNEDWQLIHSYAKLGSQWSQISKRIPGRTANSIKNHWNSTERKKFKLKTIPRSGIPLWNFIRWNKLFENELRGIKTCPEDMPSTFLFSNNNKHTMNMPIGDRSIT